MQTVILSLKVLSVVSLVALVAIAFVVSISKKYAGLPFFRHDSVWQGRRITFANWVAKRKVWKCMGPIATVLAVATVALSFLKG
jgi:hypothetical protein